MNFKNTYTNVLIKANYKDINNLWDNLQLVIEDLQSKGFTYWNNTFTKDTILYWLNDTYKIIVNNKIIGAVTIKENKPVYYPSSFNEKGTFISMFYILPKYRNIITLNIIKEISLLSSSMIILDCTQSNIKLNNFYKRLGAIKISEIRINNYKGNIFKIINKNISI